MKFKIPFNDKLFIEQTKLTLPYVYYREYKNVKESLVVVSVCFILGLLVLVVGSKLSFLFFSIAIIATFDLYWKNENYKGLKDDYIRALKIVWLDYGVTSFGQFEFNDNCLRFSTEFLCTWINWNDFQKYKIIKSNLLLIPKEKLEEIFVIGKSEVGETEFHNILIFVQEKIN